MTAYVRIALTAALTSLAGATVAAEPLTAQDLASARAYLGMIDTHPYVLEVGGWRTEADESRGWPVYVYAYGSLLQPELLLDRLCVVENRWIQGIVVDEEVKWAPELFQIQYEVWESDVPVCTIVRRSQIPEHVRLPAMIDGASLLRILDGSEELLRQALAFLSEGDRSKHSAARLSEITVSGFTYSARFRSSGFAGVSVNFSEASDGFEVHSAIEYVY